MFEPQHSITNTMPNGVFSWATRFSEASTDRFTRLVDKSLGLSWPFRLSCVQKKTQYILKQQTQRVSNKKKAS